MKVYCTYGRLFVTREGKNRVATFFSVLGLCRPRCCADVNCVSKSNFPWTLYWPHFVEGG